MKIFSKLTERGNLWAVEQLLQSGASINATTKSGETPIHYASRKGHSHLFPILEKYGAHFNSSSPQGIILQVCTQFKGTPIELTTSEEVTKLLEEMQKKSKTNFLFPFEIQVRIFSYLSYLLIYTHIRS